MGLALGQNVRKAIEDAHPYPEGRWLFIKVASKHDLDQVKQLLTVKAPLPKDFCATARGRRIPSSSPRERSGEAPPHGNNPPQTAPR